MAALGLNSGRTCFSSLLPWATFSFSSLMVNSILVVVYECKDIADIHNFQMFAAKSYVY